MKIAGLIVEYNPFHNGHLYHIKQAKAISNADMVIVVMSGNFVQRGAPAFMPKHLRAQAALEAGADIIIELPVCYATGSAEYFAMGAVALLNSLNCVDSICFGSECGDYALLEEIAEVIIHEPSEYKTSLKENLKSGMSYPAARQNALEVFLQDDAKAQIIQSPNNILGLEYIKALHQSKSSMKGYTIKRKCSSYHDKTLNNSLSSASAIRELFSRDTLCFSDLKEQVPPSSFKILTKGYAKRYPVYKNDFSLLIKYLLLNETSDSLTKYADMSTDLANRIINSRNEYVDFEQFCMLLKTRELTHARISRALIHMLLNIHKEDIDSFVQNGPIFYARILGFRTASSEILKILKEQSLVPLITRVSSGDHLTETALLMFNQDKMASDLYETILTDKFKTNFINEYSQPVLTI